MKNYGFISAALQMTVPYQWQPSIVPLQLLRVGQLVLVSVPGEFRCARTPLPPLLLLFIPQYRIFGAARTCMR